MNLAKLLPLIVLVLLAERALHAPSPWPWIFWFLLGLVVLLELVATARNLIKLARLSRPPPPPQ